jgi:Zn-dependent M28 family amino/carboxypeptidase
LDITPQAVIVLDMVGDLDQQFYFERNSDHNLQAALWDIAADFGYQEQFIPEYKWSIIDDHLPFKELGIPVADVIDFDYAAWHTAGDTLDKISAESLERIGRVVEQYLESQDSPLGSE